ncbi:MAG: glycosyltransferase [Treponema sp.]|nr:glycosyltransferase [Treponema sp.]
MRIAYSCAGEGMGHASRTTVLGPIIEERHTVVYFLPEVIRSFFVAKIGRRQFESIPHLAFQKRGERVRLLATIFATIPLLILFPLEMARLVLRLRALKIDAVISDFEPFLPWAARFANLPVLQINHPGIVQRVPKPHPHAMLTSLATRILEGPWNERIHVSFFSGDVGPILRGEIFGHPVGDEGFVLLNLKNCLRPLVLPILDSMGIAYRLFPDPRENFERALATCSCVLSTAGHQIIAESIALNKPILVIPQEGQWEQQLNAMMVDQTGKGRSTTIERLRGDLPGFLADLRTFKDRPLPGRFNVTDSTRIIEFRIEAYLGRCKKQNRRMVLVPQGMRS